MVDMIDQLSRKYLLKINGLPGFGEYQSVIKQILVIYLLWGLVYGFLV